jgi:hypothetical protein
MFSDFSFDKPLSGAEEGSELSLGIEEAVDAPPEAMLESCSRWLLIKVLDIFAIARVLIFQTGREGESYTGIVSRNSNFV